MSWTYCIKTSFRDVDLFKNGKYTTSAEYLIALTNGDADLFLLDDMANKISSIDSRQVFLDFEVPWDRGSLMTAMFEKLSTSAAPLSLVGVFSSERIRHVTGELLDSRLMINLRRLVYSASLSVADPMWPRRCGELTQSDLRQICYLAGHSIINSLDSNLSSEVLADAYPDKIQALFLFVLGVTVAIHYTRPLLESPPFPGQIVGSLAGRGNHTLWDAMKEHLCQMLTNHLVFLGMKLGLRLEPTIEAKLLTGTAIEWLPEAKFTWRTDLLLPSGNLDTTGSNTATIDRERFLRELCCVADPLSTLGQHKYCSRETLYEQPDDLDHCLTASQASQSTFSGTRLAYLSACSTSEKGACHLQIEDASYAHWALGRVGGLTSSESRLARLPPCPKPKHAKYHIDRSNLLV